MPDLAYIPGYDYWKTDVSDRYRCEFIAQKAQELIARYRDTDGDIALRDEIDIDLDAGAFVDDLFERLCDDDEYIDALRNDHYATADALLADHADVVMTDAYERGYFDDNDY